MARISVVLTEEEHRQFVNAKLDLKEKSLQSLMIRATKELIAQRNPQTSDPGVAVSNEAQGEPSRKPPLGENSLGQSTYEALQSSPSVSGPSNTDQVDPQGSISEHDQRLRALEAAIGEHSSELGEFKELLADLREATGRTRSGKSRAGARNQSRAGGRSKD